MTLRGSGTLLGLLSIVVSAALWPLMLLHIGDPYDFAAPAAWLLALVLPLIAASMSSRFWLVMMLSPLLLYAAIVTHWFER